MSHKRSDKQIKNAFEALSKKDLLAAQEAKDDVWARLELNGSTKKPNRWLLWAFLFLLFLTSLIYLATNLLRSETAVDTQPMASLLIKNQDLKTELDRSKELFVGQQHLIDSLRNQMNTSLLSSKSNDVVETQMQFVEKLIYKTDTIYLTKVEKEDLIVERIIRDTVYIEVPVIKEDSLPLIAFKEGQKEKSQASTNDTPTIPASVQFNFSETNLNKK